MELNLTKKAFAPPPIFVVGAPRSGTTLTARILGRHPKVAALGESHFFEDIWARRSEIGDLNTEVGLARAVERTLTLFGRYTFLRTQKLVDRVFTQESLIAKTRLYGSGYDALYYAWLSGLAQSVGRIYFCDDTPKHLYYLPTLLDFYSEAKIVTCVRDPRDFLSSYKNYWKRMTSDYESQRVKTLYHPILTSLLWHSSANLIARFRDHPQVFVMQYEKLVESPAEEVQKLCHFLGLTYSEALIQVKAHNSSYEQNETPGIYTTSVGRWRTVLESFEVWWVQRLNAHRMAYLGYEIETAKPSAVKALSVLLTTPIALMKALQVNVGRRGPILDYIRRRFLALVGR